MNEKTTFGYIDGQFDVSTVSNPKYYPLLADRSSEYNTSLASHLAWSDQKVEVEVSRPTNPWSNPQSAASGGVGGIALPFLNRVINDSFVNPEIKFQLWSRENAAINKWGPRSNIGGLAQALPDTLKILRSRRSDDARQKLPIQKVADLLRGHYFPTSLGRALETLPYNTSYGAPLFGRKSRHRGEVSRVAHKLLADIKANNGDTDVTAMFVASKRSREGKLFKRDLTVGHSLEKISKLDNQVFSDKTGARFVHMSPAPEVAVIGMIGEPIKDAMQSSGFHDSKTGPVKLDAFFQTHLLDKDYMWFSLDAEKFDLYASTSLITASHDVLRRIPVRYSSVWQAIVNFSEKQMLSDAIMTGTYTATGREAGFVKSGHRLTNDIDSIITLLLLHRALQTLDVQYVIQVNGDDAVVGVKTSLPASHILTAISNSYRNSGMSMNASKQLVSDRMVEMNNRLWVRDDNGAVHGPLPSVIRTLNSLFYPERLGGAEFEGHIIEVGRHLISLQHMQILSNLMRWPNVEALLKELLALDNQYKTGQASKYVEELRPTLELAIAVSDSSSEVLKVHEGLWREFLISLRTSRILNQP